MYVQVHAGDFMLCLENPSKSLEYSTFLKWWSVSGLLSHISVIKHTDVSSTPEMNTSDVHKTDRNRTFCNNTGSRDRV